MLKDSGFCCSPVQMKRCTKKTAVINNFFLFMVSLLPLTYYLFRGSIVRYLNIELLFAKNEVSPNRKVNMTFCSTVYDWTNSRAPGSK